MIGNKIKRRRLTPAERLMIYEKMPEKHNHDEKP